MFFSKLINLFLEGKMSGKNSVGLVSRATPSPNPKGVPHFDIQMPASDQLGFSG